MLFSTTGPVRRTRDGGDGLPSSDGTRCPLPAARPSCLTRPGAERAPHSQASAPTCGEVARRRDVSDVANSWRTPSTIRVGQVGVGWHGCDAACIHRRRRLPARFSGRRSRDRRAGARDGSTVTSWPWRRHAQAIADSRPPEPTTKTLTRALLRRPGWPVPRQPPWDSDR
jgi:hypothetical protein